LNANSNASSKPNPSNRNTNSKRMTSSLNSHNPLLCSSSETPATLRSSVVVALGLDQTEYEPEQHPALIYRPDDPAVVLLVFSSGKLVITGTTDPAPARTALTTLADTLTDLGLRDE
jgi:TATA-box binding protein (TBP) (component of TFIID and TFIIIB)